MKILIISRTPWDDCNSFGNTFSNLFGGMSNVTIYNICCQSGKNDNKVVARYFQMTDRFAFNAIFCKKVETSVEKFKPISNSKKKVKNNRCMLENITIKRNTGLYIIRDLIWKAGGWKESYSLKNFINKIKPEVIYLPIYASWYMCDVDSYFIKYFKIPVVGHISDDIYSYPHGYIYSPLYWLYRTELRRKIRKVISECQYLEVFAENMKFEYENIFHKECFVIGKGVQQDFNKISKIREKRESLIKFVYTGNLGDGRSIVIYKIGEVLKRLAWIRESILEVYSNTPLTSRMKREFNSCRTIRFNGKANIETVKKAQNHASYLLHVEGFSKKSIFAAKMSFSTKIIDYLETENPIIAVGPSIINSIAVLKSKGLALVVDNLSNLESTIKSILEDKVEFETIIKSTREYLQNERNIKNIQDKIYNRLTMITDNGELYEDITS